MGRRKKNREDRVLRAFEISKELDEMLKKDADSHYLSVSALIRSILESHYKIAK